LMHERMNRGCIRGHPLVIDQLDVRDHVDSHCFSSCLSSSQGARHRMYPATRKFGRSWPGVVTSGATCSGSSVTHVSVRSAAEQADILRGVVAKEMGV